MIAITDKNFHNAWARAVRIVLREGTDMIIGSVEEPKKIRDACGVIELTGDAINQIENREIHPQFPFTLINEYCEEFTPKFQTKYMNSDNELSNFEYTYFDRLVNYPSRLPTQVNINQLIKLRKYLELDIKNNLSSNRNQAITWKPYNDIGHRASPCLQRIWVRYLGNKDVEVHLTWRSRDLFTAYQVNIIAIIDMLNREVIRPNNCRIVKLVDFCNSLHIYDGDRTAADKVKLTIVSPH